MFFIHQLMVGKNLIPFIEIHLEKFHILGNYENVFSI